tara:strand:- start:442 stop:774 length:333 start_codon:yes stop_codon:yes gene_type:complete
MFGFRWVQRLRLPLGFRSSITRNGLGYSWGIPGLRFGVSPSGRKWVSFGFPGIGLYFFRYIGETRTSNSNRSEHIVSDGEEIIEVPRQRERQRTNRARRNQKSMKWKNIR